MKFALSILGALLAVSAMAGRVDPFKDVTGLKYTYSQCFADRSKCWTMDSYSSYGGEQATLSKLAKGEGCEARVLKAAQKFFAEVKKGQLDPNQVQTLFIEVERTEFRLPIWPGPMAATYQEEDRTLDFNKTGSGWAVKSGEPEFVVRVKTLTAPGRVTADSFKKPNSLLDNPKFQTPVLELGRFGGPHHLRCHPEAKVFKSEWNRFWSQTYPELQKVGRFAH